MSPEEQESVRAEEKRHYELGVMFLFDIADTIDIEKPSTVDAEFGLFNTVAMLMIRLNQHLDGPTKDRMRDDGSIQKMVSAGAMAMMDEFKRIREEDLRKN